MAQVARTHASTHEKWAERVIFQRWNRKRQAAYLISILLEARTFKIIFALSVVFLTLAIIVFSI